MPSRTGTPSQVDASAGNGSTSVTVPAGANLVVAFWSHFDGNALTSLSGLTLNGVAFTIRSQIAEGAAASDAAGVGVATLVSPATGSQTLAWTWSAGGARSEGGAIVLVYVQDANTGDPVRDSDTASAIGTNAVTVTLDSATTDLVLAYCQSFTPTAPTLDGTVFISDAALNSEIYDVSEVAAGASTITVNMGNEDYSSMAAISLKAAAAGAAGLVAAPSRVMQPLLVR